MLELVSENVILREFSKAHLHDKKYFNWLRDLDVVTSIYRMEYLMPIDFSVIEEYVHSVLSSDKHAFFAIYNRKPEVFIGTFRLGHINWRTGIADVGIMIGDKEYWGKGLGSQTLHLGIQYGFKTLSLRKLSGGTAGSNQGMRRCFERAGFVQEGIKRKELLIHGNYEDHLFYGLLKEEANYE